MVNMLEDFSFVWEIVPIEISAEFVTCYNKLCIKLFINEMGFVISSDGWWSKGINTMTM